MVMPLTGHRFTVEEFQRMGDAGVFAPDSRLELLDGEIVEITPIGVPHAAAVTRLTHLFAPLATGRATLRIQSPTVLGTHQAPQPDVAVVRYRADGYATGHPRATDVLLVVEVADSSLLADRRKKIPLYARAAVPETWLVNLPHDEVDMYRAPRDGHYTDARTAGRGETVTPLAFPDLVLRIEDILG